MFKSPIISSLYHASVIAMITIGIPSFACVQEPGAEVATSIAQAPTEVTFGDAKVWSLNDGNIELDQRIFVGVDPLVLREKLIEANVELVNEFAISTPIYAYLVDHGEQLILVDAGCNKFCGPGTGQLVSKIQATGHDLNEISSILITHLHADHIGGLVNEYGTPTFPEATVYVGKEEATYWRDPSLDTITDEPLHSFITLARNVLAAYEKIGKLHLLESGEVIAPNITAIPSYGHTPGHLAYLFTSGDTDLLLVGDVIHSAAVQFANPDWYVLFDTDGPQAAISRKKLFERAAHEHILIGGAHLPGSGMGYISQDEEAFQWTPID